MRVGAFRRISSFLFDLILMFGVTSILFTLFVGELLKPDGYEQASTEYREITEYYSGFSEENQARYDNGEITQEEYEETADNIYQYWLLNTRDQNAIIFTYYFNVVMFFVFSVNIMNYVYNLILGGRTLGRRVSGIELGGKITPWRLFIREFLLKGLFWTVTLGGGIMLDFASIALSRTKLAPRDTISGIYVKYQGVDYPF